MGGGGVRLLGYEKNDKKQLAKQENNDTCICNIKTNICGCVVFQYFFFFVSCIISGLLIQHAYI